MGEVIHLNKGGFEMSDLTYKDIADYFIALANEKGMRITNLKLQKLVYYAQAWFLAAYDEKIFNEDFQAWKHGPVLQPLYDDYNHHSAQPIMRKDLGKRKIDEIENKLGEKAEILNEVCDKYFVLSAYKLKRLTHEEMPWNKAREGLEPNVPSNRKIKCEWMNEYYSKYLNHDGSINFQNGSLKGRKKKMTQSNGVKKFDIDEIKEAGKRVDRSCRGSDEEYYDHIMSINDDLEPLRRRANKCQEEMQK